MTSPAPPSPLVAPREDTTRATSGIALFETAEALERSISSDSWMDQALAGVGFGIEFAAAVLDPLGALAAAGLGWLMEHVQPLSDVLDRLTGDPDAVTAQARTWRNVAVAVRAAGEDLTRAAEPGSDWTGEGADAFRDASAAGAVDIGVSAIVADALGAAVERAGNVVSLVRDVVRELIAQLIATLLVRIPQWTLEEVGTLGLATPHVVASALAVVAKVGKQVVGLVRALVGSLHRLGDLVDEVADLARRLFPATARPAPTGPAPTAPNAPPRPTGPVPAPTAPAATALPDAPFGPGAARAEGLSPRALLDDTATLPAARPAEGPGLPGPRPGSGPPPAEGPGSGAPGDGLANIAGIRGALDPRGPVPRPPPERPPTASERAAHRQHLERLAQRYPERYDDFSRNDPDHGGRVGRSQRREAEIALDMMDSGRWPPTIRRPDAEGDFVDAASGRVWEVKGYHSEWPDHLPDKQGQPFPQAVTRERFENDVDEHLRAGFDLLLDIRKVDAEALAFMKDVVAQRGWGDRVEWYP